MKTGKLHRSPELQIEVLSEVSDQPQTEEMRWRALTIYARWMLRAYLADREAMESQPCLKVL